MSRQGLLAADQELFTEEVATETADPGSKGTIFFWAVESSQ